MSEEVTAFVATHEVLIPDLTKEEEMALGRPLVRVKAPRNRGVIENDLEGEGDWVAFRVLGTVHHIEAYKREWLNPLA